MSRIIRIAITGATGRMAKALSVLINVDSNAELVLIPRGESITNNVDVVIDFTLPCATINYAQQCQQLNIPMVIGTTGFIAEQQQQLNDISQQIAICMAANFSVGVNVTLQLLKQAATLLNSDNKNNSFDIEIIEAHHRNKVDAPSGTALEMGKVIAESLGRNFEQCAQLSREGISDIRDSQTIGFSAIRGGDIIGEHNVIFAMQGERIEIAHKASTRDNFARGAIRAAYWLVNQSAGKYSMLDVLSGSGI